MRILLEDVILEGRTVDILVEDGRVVEISDFSGVEADKVISGKGRKIALPSFINGHTHLSMTIFRGYADDMPLRKWLEEKIWVLEGKLTEEDVYWGAKLGCLEMIKNGITVFNDMYWHLEAVAEATREMGLRAFLSAVFIDLFDEKKALEQREENLRLFEVAKGYRPHVTFTLGPHALYTVSRESLDWIREFSQREGLFVHMHLSETEQEVEFCKERYGLRPAEFLDSVGLLSERFIGAHGCWLDEDEVRLMAERGAKLVHNPVSNLKLAVGRLFPYEAAKSYGLSFCLGTDGAASNNRLDIIETMKFASLLAKFKTNDPTFLSARESFELVTERAARIFGMGDWQIKVGGSADIILIDPQRPEHTPGFDLYSDLVYASSGYVVDTVICMGRVLMEERYVRGEEEIMERARRIAKELVER